MAVYWSLATIEIKAPVEGAETISGGSVRVTVDDELVLNVLRCHLTY